MRKMLTVAALVATVALMTSVSAQAGGRRSSGCAGGNCGGGMVGGCTGGNCGAGGAMAATGGCPGGVLAVKPAGTQSAAADAQPATIVVNMPAGVNLTIDDNATQQRSAHRLFTTPALTVGKAFTYTLKAELIRDGKTETVTKVVTVHAGEQTNVTLDLQVTSAGD